MSYFPFNVSEKFFSALQSIQFVNEIYQCIAVRMSFICLFFFRHFLLIVINEIVTCRCNCTVVAPFSDFKDVGYDGLLPEELGFVNNVINKYFVEYFPRSINTSATLRELGYYEKQIYTTHPWLVRLYLHCPPNLVLSGIKLQVQLNIYCTWTTFSSWLLGSPVLFSSFLLVYTLVDWSGYYIL